MYVSVIDISIFLITFYKIIAALPHSDNEATSCGEFQEGNLVRVTAPTNLTATLTSNYGEVKLSWFSLDSANQTYIFQILYQKAGVYDAKRTYLNVVNNKNNGSYHSFIVKNLDHGVYLFQVRAFTRNLTTGEWSGPGYKYIAKKSVTTTWSLPSSGNVPITEAFKPIQVILTLSKTSGSTHPIFGKLKGQVLLSWYQPGNIEIINYFSVYYAVLGQENTTQGGVTYFSDKLKHPVYELELNRLDYEYYVFKVKTILKTNTAVYTATEWSDPNVMLVSPYVPLPKRSTLCTTPPSMTTQPDSQDVTVGTPIEIYIYKTSKSGEMMVTFMLPTTSSVIDYTTASLTRVGQPFAKPIDTQLSPEFSRHPHYYIILRKIEPGLYAIKLRVSKSFQYGLWSNDVYYFHDFNPLQSIPQGSTINKAATPTQLSVNLTSVSDRILLTWYYPNSVKDLVFFEISYTFSETSSSRIKNLDYEKRLENHPFYSFGLTLYDYGTYSFKIRAYTKNFHHGSWSIETSKLIDRKSLENINTSSDAIAPTQLSMILSNTDYPYAATVSWHYDDPLRKVQYFEIFSAVKLMLNPNITVMEDSRLIARSFLATDTYHSVILRNIGSKSHAIIKIRALVKRYLAPLDNSWSYGPWSVMTTVTPQVIVVPTTTYSKLSSTTSIKAHVIKRNRTVTSPYTNISSMIPTIVQSIIPSTIKVVPSSFVSSAALTPTASIKLNAKMTTVRNNTTWSTAEVRPSNTLSAKASSTFATTSETRSITIRPTVKEHTNVKATVNSLFHTTLTKSPLKSRDTSTLAQSTVRSYASENIATAVKMTTDVHDHTTGYASPTSTMTRLRNNTHVYTTASKSNTFINATQIVGNNNNTKHISSGDKVAPLSCSFITLLLISLGHFY